MKLAYLLVVAAACSSPSSSKPPTTDAPTQPPVDGSPMSHPDGMVGPPVKRVFATHTVYGGAFGGISAGDQLCNNAATTAHLGGTWKAWLSAGTTNAIDRLTDVGGWYLVDGATLVFGSKLALTEAPLVAIDYDENGNQIAQSSPFNIEGAWTGTTQNGQSGEDDISIGQGANCQEWLSGFGTTAMFGNVLDESTWTNVGDTNLALCDEEQEHLYCFEQ